MAAPALFTFCTSVYCESTLQGDSTFRAGGMDGCTPNFSGKLPAWPQLRPPTPQACARIANMVRPVDFSVSLADPSQDDCPLVPPGPRLGEIISPPARAGSRPHLAEQYWLGCFEGGSSALGVFQERVRISYSDSPVSHPVVHSTAQLWTAPRRPPVPRGSPVHVQDGVAFTT